MDGDRADRAIGAPGATLTLTWSRRVAPGQVWVACAVCRHPIELADTVETVEGHVCEGCVPG